MTEGAQPGRRTGAALRRPLDRSGVVDVVRTGKALMARGEEVT